MSRLLPPWALAISLNGFFLYLAGLDAIRRAPHSSTTGVWYGLVGSVCLVAAWLNRATLLERLRPRHRLTVAFAFAAAFEACWFVLNVLLVSHGPLARTLAGLLILWTVPSAVLALSLSSEQMEQAGARMALLAGVYLAIEVGVLAFRHGSVSRFSPIAYLDPISAAEFPALGALALLVLGPFRGRREVGRLAGIALLVAAAVLPGSRGPLLALVAGAALVLVLRSPGWQLVPLAAVTVGLGLGYAGTKAIGTGTYLTSAIPGASSPSTSSTAQTPSTIHIREEWWRTALADIPDAPIVGHGVAMFVDDTPEARRMHVAGELTYPHNSPLESLYSLGLIGAVPYAVFLGTAIWALAALIRRRTVDRALTLTAGLYVLAFLNASSSGEIGADAALWVAGAVAVGLYADRTTASK